jgi:uncharacterized protein (TIGR02996 family)
MTTDDLADRFDDLLRHQEERDRAYAWPDEREPTDRATRAAKLAEVRAVNAYDLWIAQQRGQAPPATQWGFPDNPELIARVLADPDADEPRLAYARWHRAQGEARSRDVADFVEGQVVLAAALRRDPRAAPAEVLAPYAHAFPAHDVPRWWRYPAGGPAGLAGALVEPVRVLEDEGLVDQPELHRGFVEHVAMRATRFLELADELFALAPIRHLTLTYCKGRDHADAGILHALLSSPHLARIRSLRLPGRVIDNRYTELNRLSDDDLVRIGAAPHLAGLGYLAFEDQELLTIRGFDALAASRGLPALRVVHHDLYRYFRVAGDYGEHRRELVEHGLARWAAELEARRGPIAWLHPPGTETELEWSATVAP